MNKITNLIFIKIFKNAFTLAEVLITLGIIGIVAALTIPTLMNTIQDRQFREAAKEAYSKAYQAVQQMNNDSGGSLPANYYTTGHDFKDAFVQYFKVLTNCNYNCVGFVSGDYKSLSNNNASFIGDDGQFITVDGMFWAWDIDTKSITVDVNGYKTGPNVWGRDTFLFQLSNDKLIPMGNSGTTYANFASAYCNRSFSSGQQGYGCMAPVMSGIDY